MICQVLFSICQQTSGRVILWPKKLKLDLGHQWQQQQEEHSTGYVSGLGTKPRAGEEVSSYTLYSSGIAEPYFTLQWEENTCRAVMVRGEISTTEEEKKATFEKLKKHNFDDWVQDGIICNGFWTRVDKKPKHATMAASKTMPLQIFHLLVC